MPTSLRAAPSALAITPARRLPEALLLNGPVLLIAAFTLLRLLLAATTPLLPQEAYYWSWSRHPALSYFDHPPLASTMIALTTAVFGSTVFGIKSAAVAWSLGWNLLWLRLIQDMYDDRRLAFWSLLALNLTLVYEAYAIGPTPDGPLLFGWVGTIWAVWRAGTSGQARWWLLAGVLAGLGLLGKYAAVLLLPVLLLYLATSPTQRHWLRGPWPYLGMLIAAAMFTPVLLWNAEHQWVSFAFQSSRRAGQMAAFKPRFFGVLLATQLLLVTPWLFGLSLTALWRAARDAIAGVATERTRLLLFSAAVPLLLFTAISFRSLVKINWLAPAYWSLIILGMHQWLQSGASVRRLAWGLGSSAVLLVGALVISVTPNLPIVGNMNSWSGWKEAAQRVDQASLAARAGGQSSFVFSPNYKISSLLRFYLPGQPRTYAQDIYGARALQFDYFPLDSDLKGATGILVLSDQSQAQLDLARVAPYFDALERVDVLETRAFGRVVRRVEIYRGTNYKGHPRLDPLRGAPSADDASAGDAE
ncbi:MAG TPA: glycosyltransferase family 39 protein [Rubrivivax sp.]|jgi:4-amino-4-deoxy-L-arabinose transferase-like glycosyltransferase|nr:glycosyltransferase family 39 protein [Rubrivivax sp.]